MSVPDAMRAALLYAPRREDAGEDVRVEEVPVPTPGPGQVLVRILACGVCASDLHVVQGVTPHGPTLPQILGHEPAGEIAAVGPDVADWQPGDRVAIGTARVCGRCGYCLSGRENLCVALEVLGITTDGAQAEYALADARYLTPVPAGMPIEQAAILTDAVATPYHALKRAGVGEGVTVAIHGLGGLGMHAIQLARLAGAAQIIGVDIDEVCLQRALEWGADAVVDANDGKPARRVKELSEGGVDRVLEFIGTRATVDQAIKSLAPGGRAALVGLSPEPLGEIPIGLFVAQEMEVVGSFGATPQDLNELFDLVDAGRLDLSRSITHRFDLDSFPEALRQLETREQHPIRMVVNYD